jgi:hypothetical protein
MVTDISDREIMYLWKPCVLTGVFNQMFVITNKIIFVFAL